MASPFPDKIHLIQSDVFLIITSGSRYTEQQLYYWLFSRKDVIRHAGRPSIPTKIAQEVLTHLASQDLAGYTIYLQISEQIMVWADPQFLRQVLRNLFSNIFKYVPKQIGIHIEATQTDPSSPVYLNIQDAGPGIPAYEQLLLFERFVRLKRDLGGSTRGTGLGLYICKQLVEAMGGRI